jgi:hypothetical protein
MYTRMVSPVAQAAKILEGPAMDRLRWSLLLTAIAVASCRPAEHRTEQKTMLEGRTYTAWLYGSEYNKLWDRFSPEMRQTFGSVSDLADFANRALKNLGAERGKVNEQVNAAEPFTVYSRSASFDKSRQRMLIEWSLAKDGAVTGLVVRPAVADSGAGR